GTFVVGPQPMVDLFTLGGTTAAFEDAGLRLLTNTVEAVQRHETLDAEAGPLMGRAGYRFARVGRVGVTPVLLERMYLDARVFPDFDAQQIDQEPLSRLVERKYHRRPTGGHQTLRTHQLMADESRLLQVELGVPALLIERTLQFREIGPALFTRIFALTDRVVLAQSLTEPLRLACVLARQEEKI
ncbi:MAG TPA: GntR family transcriptional regulator, partial [Polyangiaceae bacterium]|nr:GntR family transcriptional regulator [Polyangiaceae bacterium]